MRLARRTRTALRRGTRVRVTVSITVADAAGARRTVGLRATLRAARR